jgi:penicillin-binding protein 1A
VPADKVAEMNNIMTHVVTEGTGRAAQIPGSSFPARPARPTIRPTPGSTVSPAISSAASGSATTTARSMGDMTGGTLPALSWREIMTYAHRDLEPKPPFGVAAPATPAAVAATGAKGQEAKESTPRAATLTPKAARILLEIGEIARAARERAALAPGEDHAGLERAATTARADVLTP